MTPTQAARINQLLILSEGSEPFTLGKASLKGREDELLVYALRFLIPALVQEIADMQGITVAEEYDAIRESVCDVVSVE